MIEEKDDENLKVIYWEWLNDEKLSYLLRLIDSNIIFWRSILFCFDYVIFSLLVFYDHLFIVEFFKKRYELDQSANN